MTTTPVFKLIWNQVAHDEWQAGALTAFYQIEQDGHRYHLRWVAPRLITKLATADSLGAAKDAALIDLQKNPGRGR